MTKLTAHVKPKFYSQRATLSISADDLSLILSYAKDAMEKKLQDSPSEVVDETITELVTEVKQMIDYLDDEDSAVRITPLIIK